MKSAVTGNAGLRARAQACAFMPRISGKAGGDFLRGESATQYDRQDQSGLHLYARPLDRAHFQCGIGRNHDRRSTNLT